MVRHVDRIRELVMGNTARCTYFSDDTYCPIGALAHEAGITKDELMSVNNIMIGEEVLTAWTSEQIDNLRKIQTRIYDYYELDVTTLTRIQEINDDYVFTEERNHKMNEYLQEIFI